MISGTMIHKLIYELLDAESKLIDHKVNLPQYLCKIDEYGFTEWKGPFNIDLIIPVSRIKDIREKLEQGLDPQYIYEYLGTY